MHNKIDVNFGDVRNFLDGHPELFTKKDYSGFISSLHVIYSTGSGKDRGDVEETFRAVSAAMFLRALKDYPKKGQYLFYLLPLAVDFSPKDFNPSNKADMRDVYKLCVEVLPSQIVPATQDPLGNYIPIIKVISQSVQVVPLVDNTLAKIEFRYYPELPSTLPQA